MKYGGFNPELERQNQSPEDWQFGAASLPCIALIPESEREEYLPIGEVQAGKQDTGDCATRAPTNILEAKLTYHYRNGMRPENKKWLEDNGYIQGFSVTLSDAFTAILSGTTRNGNSLLAPLKSIHSNGMIPKRLLPLEPWMLWDDYMDFNRITKAMTDMGQEFLRRFTINYERVSDSQFAEVLKTDMIDVAGHAWPVPENGVYPRIAGDFNHAWALYRLPAFQAFDNYEEKLGDFTKNLAPDYIFWDTGYRVFISAETTPEDRQIQKTVFDVLSANGLISFFADWWDRFTTAVRGYLQDREFGAVRSPRWPSVRAAHLKEHPACEVCGGTKNCSVHHKVPFHLNPALELDPANLITLCEGSGNGNHHLLFGHLGDFKSFNADIATDAPYWRNKITHRP